MARASRTSIQPQLTGSVLDDPDDVYEFVQPTAGTPAADVRRIPIIVPSGTRYLRVALFNGNSSPGADLDLYLRSCPGFLTCTEEAEASVGLGVQRGDQRDSRRG